MINVTKSYLPPIERYTKYLRQIWKSNQITNNGALLIKLENRLKKFLGVKHLFLITNGTIALQMAIKALDLKGEIITTPFSYVATTSSLVWEGCTPVFADIDPLTLTIDPSKIVEKISPKTTAILATHVYGNVCDVETIKRIAQKYHLKVIYDAAHSFGVKYKGKSVLRYGDISVLSFHATKLFHTVEGGAIVTGDNATAAKVNVMRHFGHKTPESFFGLGINGKNSEFHAAMGLSMLPEVPKIVRRREKLSRLYDQLLLIRPNIKRPQIRQHTVYNYAYYPVIFESEKILLKVTKALNSKNIFPRRYFYPSLTKLPYVDKSSAIVSDDIATRIMCLPLYFDLEVSQIRQICKIVLKEVKSE